MQIWKDIKDYEGLYQISNDGQVKSLIKNKILKPYIHKDGYLVVRLYLNKQQKHFFVHRLVAQAFIPNINNLPIINHLDCNPQNNNVENLEWCTQSQNVQYAYFKNRVNKSLLNKHRERKIVAIKDNKEVVYNSITEACKELKINKSSICDVCKGKYKSTHGYVFKYI